MKTGTHKLNVKNVTNYLRSRRLSEVALQSILGELNIVDSPDFIPFEYPEAVAKQFTS